MSDTFEITSRITDEISEFLDEIGVDPVQYEYEYNYDEEDRVYSAKVRLLRGDVEGVCASFSEYQDEFSDHLTVSFPDIEVQLTLLVGGCSDTTGCPDDEYAEDEYDTLSTDNYDDLSEEAYGILDDTDSRDTDSVERQYADEGLSIVDEDDEDPFYTEEVEKRRVKYPTEYDTDDDDEDEDDDEDYSPRRSRKSRTARFEDEEDDRSDDAYRPSAEDMEDLWAAFGSSNDEY